MTVQNDFIPFASGAGANVLSQSAYASLPAVTGGFSSGILAAAQLNKALRQSSVIAAAVAKLIADKTGLAVVDDGTTATIEANLIAAIQSLAAGVASGQITSLSLGAMSREGIGQGLEDDGAGNVRVKLADTSIRRSASGVQTNDPVTVVAANQSVTSANHGSTLLVTGAAVTVTAPATSTLWNGYNVTIVAKGGPVTFAVNAVDKTNGGAAGSGYTVLQNQSVNLVCDGAGNWYSLFQTGVTIGGSFTPLYVTTSQTLGAGTYEVDTTSGPITVTLPSGVAAGTTLEFSDPYGTWGTNNLTLARNGNTILGSATDLVCDMSGETFRIIYNGSDWRLF